MRSAFFALSLIATVTAANAQVQRSFCETLGSSVNRAADASTGYLEGLQAADLSNFEKQSVGDLNKAVVRAQAAREKLIPAMKDYAEALQDLGYQFRICARR